MAVQQRLSDDQHSSPCSTDWHRALPVLSGATVTLRTLVQSDAHALQAQVARPAVAQYLVKCPQSVQEFRRFIRWTHAQRRLGAHVCYGIVPAHQTTPVGLVQVWSVERDFSTAEWGFLIGEPYWGTGLFVDAARLLLDFAFDRLGVLRLEARAVGVTSRGSGVLRKLGATPEGVLRAGFRNGVVTRDQVMWSILACEWVELRRRTGGGM